MDVRCPAYRCSWAIRRALMVNLVAVHVFYAIALYRTDYGTGTVPNDPIVRPSLMVRLALYRIVVVFVCSVRVTRRGSPHRSLGCLKIRRVTWAAFLLILPLLAHTTWATPLNPVASAVSFINLNYDWPPYLRFGYRRRPEAGNKNPYVSKRRPAIANCSVEL